MGYRDFVRRTSEPHQINNLLVSLRFRSQRKMPHYDANVGSGDTSGFGMTSVITVTAARDSVP